jgi:phosphoglycolate phosphatase-like HAD superfamily hydrolase
MVGDHQRDLQAARAVEIPFFASSWGYLRPEQFEALGVPRFQILRSPTDLLRIIE